MICSIARLRWHPVVAWRLLQLRRHFLPSASIALASKNGSIWSHMETRGWGAILQCLPCDKDECCPPSSVDSRKLPLCHGLHIPPSLTLLILLIWIPKASGSQDDSGRRLHAEATGISHYQVTRILSLQFRLAWEQMVHALKRLSSLTSALGQFTLPWKFTYFVVAFVGRLCSNTTHMEEFKAQEYKEKVP